MPRPYHSPSSIALGKLCPRAWALQYLENRRDPDVAWTDDFLRWRWDNGTARYWSPDETQSISAAQRGAALGKAAHATAERWYDPKRGAPDWSWFPGRVLAAGKHLLPEPSKIERVHIERGIGDRLLPLQEGAREGAPTTALEVHGILWAGFVDNEAHGRAELARLRINAPAGLVVIDYKTTSSLDRFALTHSELLTDPQAALYAAATCKRHGLASVPERWVYFESKQKRRAIAVDVTAELSRALDVLGPCADLARRLDALTHVGEAPKNPLACYAYGNPERINCRHHVVNGGDCNTWAPFKTLVQITPKPEILVMTEALSAAEREKKFEAKRKEMAAKAAGQTAAAKPKPKPVATLKLAPKLKPAPVASEPETEPEETEQDDAVEAEDPTLPDTAAPAPELPKPAVGLRPRGRPAALPATGQSATIAALAAELAAVDKTRAQILARLRAAVA
jgi:hypothetical protein